MASPTVLRDLEGKVALVTGATSGIGKAAAVQLADIAIDGGPAAGQDHRDLVVR